MIGLKSHKQFPFHYNEKLVFRLLRKNGTIGRKA